MKILLYITLASVSLAQSGGPWQITSSTLDGGGQVSTGGTWRLTGTIGQADAGAAKFTGGSYSLAGGFWPTVITQPGGPTLSVAMGSTYGVPGTARFAYTAAAVGYQLQYSEDLLQWTNHGGVITSSGAVYWGLHNGPKYFFRLELP